MSVFIWCGVIVDTYCEVALLSVTILQLTQHRAYCAGLSPAQYHKCF